MVSLLLSIMLIIYYSMAVHTVFAGEEVGSFSWYSYSRTPDQNVTRTKTLTAFVLLFSCLEFLLCLGSIAYVAYAYRRDFKRKPVKIAFVLLQYAFHLLQNLAPPSKPIRYKTKTSRDLIDRVLTRSSLVLSIL